MRVISLSDGRICYVKPAYSRNPLPPGEAVAFANVAGQPRVVVRIPKGWPTVGEAELRGYVERQLRATAAAAPPPPHATDAVPTQEAPQGVRGLLSRWLKS